MYDLAGWYEAEQAERRAVFAPPVALSPSEWAEKYRILSQGPDVGRPMSLRRTPYLAEILDFVARPWAREGCVMKSARIGYTEGVLGNVIGFTIDADPCTVAVLQPTDGEAKAYSRENITPMIEHNPRMAAKLVPVDPGNTGQRRQDATMAFKAFPGGSLVILGSVAGPALRRRSIKRALADEIDAMEADRTEGDPLQRFAKRTADYEDGVMLCGSTPLVKGLSQIEARWKQSDQRRWVVPCPCCGHRQALEWGGPRNSNGIKWLREVSCGGCGRDMGSEGAGPCPDCGFEERRVRNLPDTAHYVCAGCGEAIAESDKPAMVRAGRWEAECPERRSPGWHINALASLAPTATWAALVGEFLKAKDDPELLRVWVNTVLGEPWEDRGEKPDVSTLEARAEEYVGPGGEAVEVPDGVGILTAGVDVQHDRLEVLVRGWGIAGESWDVLHERVWGDSLDRGTWARLDHTLAKGYRHASGALMRIQAAMIDSGDRTQAVYEFVKPRERRRVWASKGDAGRAGAPAVKRSVSRNAGGVKLWTLGVYTLMDELFARLRVSRPGPRYVHLRAPDPDLCNGFDAEYFAQFGAETKRRVKRKDGRPEFRYIQVRRRNEALDLQVLCAAALAALGGAVRDRMERYVEAARQGESAAPLSRPRRRRIVSAGIEA